MWDLKRFWQVELWRLLLANCTSTAAKTTAHEDLNARAQLMCPCVTSVNGEEIALRGATDTLAPASSNARGLAQLQLWTSVLVRSASLAQLPHLLIHVHHGLEPGAPSHCQCGCS